MTATITITASGLCRHECPTNGVRCMLPVGHQSHHSDGLSWDWINMDWLRELDRLDLEAMNKQERLPPEVFNEMDFDAEVAWKATLDLSKGS